jgi:predicted enzyme related to lactoylglutathione lyase
MTPETQTSETQTSETPAPAAPTTGLQTVLYPVTDLAAARDLYGALLGVPPVMDEPYYVGFRVAGQDVGLDPNGHARGLTGPLGYWHVESMDDTIAALTARGATLRGSVTDVGGGKLVATLTDADGNEFGVLQMP